MTDTLVIVSRQPDCDPQKIDVKSTQPLTTVPGFKRTEDDSTMAVYVGPFPDALRLGGAYASTIVFVGDFDEKTLEYLATRVRNLQ